MTTTILHSASREVRIGFDHPFCVIGERINPTGRKLLAAEMAAGDFGRVEEEARAQVAAGAHMLDVNAGIPLTDEAALLAQCVVRVQAVTDVPLAIDSSVVSALAAGLAAYQGKALVNSVTGEEERLETILPLVKNMARRWSPLAMTKAVFPKTPTFVSTWHSELSRTPPITASPPPMSLSTRW